MNVSILLFALTVFLICYHLLPGKYFVFFVIPYAIIFLSHQNYKIAFYIIACTACTIYFAKLIADKKKKYAFIFGILFQIVCFFAGHIVRVTNYNSELYFLTFTGYAIYFTTNITYLTQHYYGLKSNLSSYLLHQFWFPRLVNGPVSDPILFEKQWKIAIKPDLEINILKIMLGLFKILVLSGNLNISTESVFSYNAFYSGITSVTASILYSLQLYFEFSGYIELTLAFSNLCGIPLLENFNLPFYAKNMQEFWQRWHISLTQWLTQYIFVPIYKLLSVRINKTLAASLSTMAVFLGMGIWNGFNIGYIISGFLFGIFSVIAFLKNRKRKKVNDSLLYLWVNRIKVFLIFTFCLFFYRVNNWNEITFQIRNMYSDFIPDNFHSSYLAPLAGGGDQSNYFLFTLTITICFGYLFFEKRLSEKNFQSKHFIPLSISIALLIIILGQFGSNRVFEYMQVK